MKYSLDPGYAELFSGIYNAARHHYRAENMRNYEFPASFFKDFAHYFKFSMQDAYYILALGVLITFVRYAFEYGLCRPLVRWFNIDGKSDRQKFPESFWKLTIYSLMWGYTAYLVIVKYKYFQEPYVIWDDWVLHMEVPADIRFLYFFECGFYVHGVYATLYMDAWRRDSIVMLIHHFVTMTLIVVSYATGYYKIGTLVLFTHDATDILLEFTKCNVYLKRRNKHFFAAHEHLSNVTFGLFTVAWFVFRLYWYPFKVLYTSGCVGVYTGIPNRGAGLYGFFNTLLWILQILNIYWFYFILLFLYKVVTGQLNEINDTREYEEGDEEPATATKDKKKKAN